MKKTKEQISYNMSKVCSTGSRIEKLLGKSLWAVGFRYRKNYNKLFGKPDFVLPKYRLAIFCDSSFWHGYKGMATSRHNFRSNKKFWKEKISRNIQRDKEVNRLLKREGWKVIRFWDFQIENSVELCVKKILGKIRK